MKYRATALTVFIWTGFFAALSQADGPRPLQLADILAWKRIQAPAVSNGMSISPNRQPMWRDGLSAVLRRVTEMNQPAPAPGPAKTTGSGAQQK